MAKIPTPKAISEEYKKPPLGIMPEFFWKRQRILELCRAINDYINECIQDSCIEKWTEELNKMVKEYNNMNKRNIK